MISHSRLVPYECICVCVVEPSLVLLLSYVYTLGGPKSASKKVYVLHNIS